MIFATKKKKEKDNRSIDTTSKQKQTTNGQTTNDKKRFSQYCEGTYLIVTYVKYEYLY